MDRLTEKEKRLLYQAPVLVGVLAVLKDTGKITEKEIKDAVQLVHYRTFTSPPILHEFYKSCEKTFEVDLSSIIQDLPADTKLAEERLIQRLNALEPIQAKLSDNFDQALRQSLYSFGKHVAKAGHSWLESLTLFIDPFIPLE